jgi:hypothetical protein
VQADAGLPAWSSLPTELELIVFVNDIGKQINIHVSLLPYAICALPQVCLYTLWTGKKHA